MRINRDWQPGYAGAGLTFLRVPLALETSDLAGADVAILGAPMDELVTYRPGARFGPRAIREGQDEGGRAWHMDLGVDPLNELKIVDHADAEVVPGDPHASHKAIREAVGRIVDAGVIPVILGGDHSIAYPNVSAVAAAYESGSLAVVQFDTHTDTATQNWDVEWAHGTPFRNLVDHGILPGERLIQVGLRGYWPNPAEWEWARTAGVRWHRMETIVERGIDAVIDDVIHEVGDATHLFLSVDIDCLDPSFAPGTGTPEPGGMSTRELFRAVRRLATTKALAGMEVVEVSPPYDHAGITALAANRVIIEALSGLALQRSGRAAAPEEPSS